MSDTVSDFSAHREGLGLEVSPIEIEIEQTALLAEAALWSNVITTWVP